jgi:Fe-S-cluster containining protein
MKEPWYKDGLRFKCTGCGQCCTGFPGYVWIDEAEIAEMAKFLNISMDTFIEKYTRKVGDAFSLIEDPTNYDCVFLEERKCRVYGARPHQCRAFPWWPDNLKTKKEWKEAAKHCEGIEHPDAPLITLEQIHSAMKGEESESN